MNIALILVIVLSFSSASFATKGFDLSYYQGDVSSSDFSCLKSNGYDFGIIEATKGSQATLNPYISSVVSNARKHIKNIDVYIFPDTSHSASSLMNSFIKDLKKDGVLTNNMIWMDIEGTQYWSGSCSNNQKWLKEAINTINGLYTGCGHSTCVGIYTSESQWSPIMCNTSEFSNHQLWYAHYDGKASFSDFKAFGGWTKPNMKQYQGTTNICNTQIDKDYY
uniref:Lysozyme n=1 Tax=Vannella robusta TaxID=1487602 RepID=A0A6U1XB29_9EUKA|mmetsp:Transcript_7064/g.8769  ORF Transcript_7064/g.8769 Transcript_7064/m.8769 type:complete len:222 (+) Transcript_7064:325-990(+)